MPLQPITPVVAGPKAGPPEEVSVILDHFAFGPDVLIGHLLGAAIGKNRLALTFVESRNGIMLQGGIIRP
jgi:hypothetical protein